MYNRKRRKNRRKPKIVRFLLLILLLTAIASAISHQLKYSSESPANSEISRISDNFEDEEAITLNEEIHSSHAISIDLANNKVLFQKASDERTNPASLTKIMTAILAIDSLPDLEQPVLLKKDIFADLYAQNASMAGFVPNEQVKIIDLLYGIMLPSGAEAAIGLAEHVAGSEQAFVVLMNHKAQELGMKDTHFTNVTGLHDVNHYTTVKDLAVLLKYALKNETFKEIFTSKRHSTKPTNMHSTGVTFVSTMFEKIGLTEFDGGEIIGGKTGYTQQAGLCLASLAVKNGKNYILVTTGAEGNPRSEQYNITDAFRIYGEYLK